MTPILMGSWAAACVGALPRTAATISTKPTRTMSRFIASPSALSPLGPDHVSHVRTTRELHHRGEVTVNEALGQFASPYFVASGSASPQRTPTYASGCRPARASSGSQLAPVPAPKLTHDHSCLVARRGLRVWQRMRASESA